MTDTAFGPAFLESAQFRFESLKSLGDRAMAQLSPKDLHWSPDAETNSIAVLIQHLRGNMRSRWTDFLTTDGEKPWRDRDGEFTADPSCLRDELLNLWDEGWACCLDALRALTPDDLAREVTVRGQALGVLDAIERQHSHYAYHVGQIVLLARMRCGADWQTLSIARGQSMAYRPTKRD